MSEKSVPERSAHTSRTCTRTPPANRQYSRIQRAQAQVGDLAERRAERGHAHAQENQPRVLTRRQGDQQEAEQVGQHDHDHSMRVANVVDEKGRDELDTYAGQDVGEQDSAGRDVVAVEFVGVIGRGRVGRGRARVGGRVFVRVEKVVGGREHDNVGEVVAQAEQPVGDDDAFGKIILPKCLECSH